VSLHRVDPDDDADRTVLERLWQLYAHDLSEFRGSYPDDEGLFRAGRLPTYLADPDRSCHLVRSDGRIAGFGLVRGLHAGPHVMGEFFVVRAARRTGVGRAAALALLRSLPGRWEIAFQRENPAAATFWRRVATELVGDDWTEEARPVPDKPELPADVWLGLEVRADHPV
jgi:predicted acetyltransferase